jgi:O-antigen ligase
MYTGDPVRGDRGFLGYNTHNQFLETLLQTGIIGLLILLVLCISLVKMAWQKKSMSVGFIIILLLLWMFSESVFETQYGIIIFTFFPLFIYYGQKWEARSSIRRD